MQTWILFAVLVGTIVVVGAGLFLFLLLRNERMAQGPTPQGRYPRGHWMSIGMCLGIALGCIPSMAGLLSDAMSPFVGVGPAIGVALGFAIGTALEERHKDELRPLTEEERQTRARLTVIGLGALALLILSVVVLGGILMVASR